MAPHTPVRMLVVDNEPGVAGGLVPSPAQARRDRMARSQQLWSTGQELRRKSARLIAEVQTLRATSTRLRGTEAREPLCTRLLLIICAWGKTHIRWQRLQDVSPLHTSYGMCPSCLVKVKKEGMALRNAQ